MYIYVHAAFLLNFILKNISPKKLIKDGNWYKRSFAGIRMTIYYFSMDNFYLPQKYLAKEYLNSKKISVIFILDFLIFFGKKISLVAPRMPMVLRG